MKKSITSLIAIVVLLSTLLSLTSCKLFAPVELKKCDHVWSNWILELDPTCCEAGRQGRKCSECEEVEYELIPATEKHYSTTWIIDKAVTCTENGEQHKVCDDCGAEFGRTTILAAHVFENDACRSCGANIDDYFTFTYNNNQSTYEVSSKGALTNTGANIILPETYKGESVTMVKNRGFYQNTFVENVVIPEGYTTIGEFAFSSCYLLKSVVIPETALEIMSNAFSSCQKLTEVKLPVKLEKIPIGCFGNCTSLASVVFPANLIEIGNSAFAGCGFTEVIIPDTVKYVRSGAFSYCKNLATIVVGIRVKLIEGNAFNAGIALTSIVFRNPHGWVLKAYLIESGNPIDVPIAEEDLKQTRRAALFFTNKYKDYTWGKG